MGAGGRSSLWYLEGIEAMHLLPQSFVFQATYSSSQGRLTEQRHSSSQPLFILSKSLPHLLPRQAFSFPTQSFG